METNQRATGVARSMVGAAALLAILQAALIGLIYGWFVHENAFYYVNLLATVGTGLLSGRIAVQASAWTALPGARSAALLGVACGVASFYGAWVGWLYALAGVLVLDPTGILVMAREVAVRGVWAIDGWAPTGRILYALWLAEAGCIVLAAAMTAHASGSTAQNPIDLPRSPSQIA